MEANYVHKDSTTLIQAELVQNELNQIELQYNALKQQKFNELLKENQALKKQLEEKQNPFKGIFAQVNDDTLLRDCGNMNVEINELKNQQKEFIKYLENRIDICDGFLDTVKSDLQETPYGVISANEDITTRIKENETAHKVYEEILQKYKSIIGVSDEKK